MPLAVSVNGRLEYGAGAYSTFSVVPTSGVSPQSIGTVQLIGEADAGPPGLALITRPSDAKSIYRGGVIANAILAAFNPSTGEADVPGGAYRVYVYKTNQSTQAASSLPLATGSAHTTTAGSTATVIQYTGTPFTASQHIGRWLKIGSEKRRITANTTSAITVSPGFTTAPGSGVSTTVLGNACSVTAQTYGVHGNGTSIEFEATATAGQYTCTVALEDRVETFTPIGRKPYFRLMYKGGPIPALTGTEPASGTIASVTNNGLTVNVTLASAPTSGTQFNAMVLELPGNRRRLIASHTTATTPCPITLDAAHALTASEISAVTGGTATVRNVTSATATMNGTAGDVTGFSTAVLPTADDTSYVFDIAFSTLRQFIDLINATSNYIATAAAGINVDTALLNDFDFGASASAVDIRFDAAVEDAILSGDTAPTKRSRFFQDLMELVRTVNASSKLVTLARSTAGSIDGTQLPDVTGGIASSYRDVAIYLTAGARGSSTNTNWQTGFDELGNYRGNSVVPLITYDLAQDGLGSTATFSSVAAMLQLHIDQRNGALANEARGYMGMAGTFTSVRNQARTFNHPFIQLAAQKATFLDINGALTQQGEWLIAVMAAGMRAGAREIGTPLTRKGLRVTALSQDSSWDPHDHADVNSAIADGLLIVQDRSRFGETGFKFNRDRTTYVGNSAQDIYNDGNMGEELLFLVYDLRQRLETTFLGQKNHTGAPGAVATVTAIKDETNAILESYVKEPYRILTYSEDPDDTAPAGQRRIVPGFDRVTVRSEGNATRIGARVFLTPDTAFILPEIVAAIPSVSA